MHGPGWVQGDAALAQQHKALVVGVRQRRCQQMARGYNQIVRAPVNLQSGISRQSAAQCALDILGLIHQPKKNWCIFIKDMWKAEL